MGRAHEDGHHHDHEHIHDHHHSHHHDHSGVDSGILENREAIKVLLISLIGLFVTAAIQAIIVGLSSSTALMADAIHNFADALTSIPLWLAFSLSARPATKRFSYGLNRSEDIAGLAILLVIFASACVAGYESVIHLIHNTPPTHLAITSLAAVVGFLGNELAAVYRIRMGKRMGSAALIADGQHARIDGFTSLAVLIGVAGTWLGYPMVDAVIGLVITLMILWILKDSAKQIFVRLLDGIEPEVVDEILEESRTVAGVITVTDVKARWIGHGIHSEVTIIVDSELTVREGHDVAKNVIHALHGRIEHLGEVQVHVDPVEEPGFTHHLGALAPVVHDGSSHTV
jgi:cation diffusion facilitator family transporter